MGVWGGRLGRVPEQLPGDTDLTFFGSPEKQKKGPSGWHGWLEPLGFRLGHHFCLQNNEPWGPRTSLLSASSRLRNNLQPPGQWVPYLRPVNEQSLNCIGWILLSFSFTPLSLQQAYRLFVVRWGPHPLHKGEDISWPFCFPPFLQVGSHSIIISLYTNTHRCLHN